MEEVSLNYWNKLAEQTIVISSLLGGFSITVIANFLISEVNTRLHRYLLVCATLSASFFLITVFSMTNILLKTTKGYPLDLIENSLTAPKLIGGGSFYLGIVSLVLLISLSGWTKSRRLGLFTTIVGLITLIITFMMTAI